MKIQLKLKLLDLIVIYDILLLGYSVVLRIASLFNDKAKLWVEGRKNWRNKIANNINSNQNRVWFHFASLGEFEQGRPVMEQWKEENPDDLIFISFFSPSGYEIRKKYPLAEYVTYLPLDTVKNARDFIRIINPKVAIFTKYEYWFHFYSELSKQKIPIYLISAIYTKNQPFFKWYGSLHVKMLNMLQHIFVQDEHSKILLESIDIKHVTIAGDTRFDRVWTNHLNKKQLPQVIEFIDGKPCFIAGSTYSNENEHLIKIFEKYSDWKLIIAPHEPKNKMINKLMHVSKKRMVKYSNYSVETEFKEADVLVIDTIGLLSSIYSYSDIAYIGGGFGKGIHNTLEAAVAEIPIIIGPKYQKFNEAKNLVHLNAAFVATNFNDLENCIHHLITNPTLRETAGSKAKKYVETNIGSTEKILKLIIK